MAYNLKKHHDATYYTEQDLYGSYQFVSLEDIINQFMFVYVGDEKIINKTSRTDVAFWAQRALAEMSFDTFKSVKAQQIELPPSLTMILPHDYVNYTKVSWVDTSGIKHPLYSTKDTSNPFQVRQLDNGDYDFPEQPILLNNPSFDSSLGNLFAWTQSFQNYVSDGANYGSIDPLNAYSTYSPGTAYITSSVVANTLTFSHAPRFGHNSDSINGSAQAVWQKINVEGIDFLDIGATAETTTPKAGDTTGTAVLNLAGDAASSVPYWTVHANNYYASDSGTSGAGNYSVTAAGTKIAAAIPGTTVRIGISASPGYTTTSLSNFNGDDYPTPNGGTDIFDVGYLEWDSGDVGYKVKEGLDVSGYSEVYLLITSIAPWATNNFGNNPGSDLFVKTTIDDIYVQNSNSANDIQGAVGTNNNSSTWQNYSSATPSENNNNDYEDDTYWPHDGERYGLDPAHAQVNGSFYVDNLAGKINFSSNISGKTVILDYISDSLGTTGEMQVHKLAEDAMYKSILCDLMSTRRGVGRGQLMYYKKDKFAAVRKAKLRLSNIKLEDLTRILRGKSKQIKH